MSLFEQLTRWLITKLLFIGLGLSILFSSSLGKVDGLAQVNPNWSDPINLSNSGFADNPAMAIDSNGIYHVVWLDEFAGIVYVTGDGVDWSVPEVVALPSDDIIPLLFADKNGYVHAFWYEREGMLYHSRVRGEDFTSSSAWTARLLLSDSALSFDVAIDDNGDIHLGFVRPEEALGFPAGVYHRRLRNESVNWSELSMLYFSHYLRSTELENSNVDVSTSSVDDNIGIFVAWDNFPRGRVYLAISMDGGQTWSDPEDVDKPDKETGTSSTANIKVSSIDQYILLVWQRRDARGNCSGHYRWSDDNGDTWSKPQQMFEDSSDCREENQLLRSEYGQIILWTILQDQVNLLAWDQKKWSAPQVQHELSAIEDPETLSLVTFSCMQPHMGDDDLAVVGCDTGGGGDIWFINRELSDISNWYSSPSDWSDPEELVNSQNGIDSPVLVAGSDEFLHVLWSQAASVVGNEGSTSIYYMGWDGEFWSQPLPFFQSSSGDAGQPSAALNDNERLLVVWSESQSGEILFSWANSGRASRVAEWSVPVPLPISQLVAVSPNILVDYAGTINVAYAVPINEGRGIYLTRSTNGGETWSSPAQIFNGVSSEWQIVDQPQLTQTTDGNLHALWLHKALLGDEETLGLFYAHSEDDGVSWSEAEPVVDGEVKWSQITSDAQGSVYRIWQEVINNQPIIRYQRSLDSDAGWSLPESLSSFGESLRIAKIVVDQVGQLHLLQIVQDLSERLILRHWMWEDGRWVVSENTELAYAPSTDVISMAATVSSDEELDVVYSTITDTELSEVLQNNLYFTNRLLELPSVVIPVEQTITPEPVIIATPLVIQTTQLINTPTIEPTNTPAFNRLDLIDLGDSSNNSLSGLVIGGVLAGLIVLVAVGYGIWRVRKG